MPTFKMFGQRGLGPLVAFGKGGPTLANDGGVLKSRAANGMDLAVMQGADGVAANDFVTVGQLPLDGLRMECVDISHTSGASVNIGDALPLGARVLAVLVNVTEEWVDKDGVPTLTIGYTDHLADLMGDTENDLKTVDTYGGLMLISGMPDSTQLLATLTHNGGATGAAEIAVIWAKGPVEA